MRTVICDLLGIDVPIVQAPMGGAATPRLAAAVCNAGGLGTLPLWRASADVVRQQVRELRKLTDRPFAVNLNLDFPQEERLSVCLEERVPIISFFWKDPSALVDRAKRGGALVMHTAASAREAEQAARLGVDVVVAQGWEAGGHVRGTVATLPLVPRVVDAVHPVPVIAAGGIADGRGLAAALALGAAGAWIGTRFLASDEAAIHETYRERLLAADETDTVYLEDLFEVGWPNAPHRTLKNPTVGRWEAAGRPSPGQRPGQGEVIGQAPFGDIVRYQSTTPTPATQGRIEEMSLWAGQTVGLVSRRQPAAEIVREIVRDADAVLRRLAKPT